MSRADERMGIYSKYVLPKPVDFACGMRPTMQQRAKVVALTFNYWGVAC